MKFDSLKWTTACGCGDTPTKAFCEVDQGGGSGFIIKQGSDDQYRVTQYAGGQMVRDGEVMAVEQIEALL